MTAKKRLSASVDPEVLTAAEAAVAAGAAPNISAWVNAALHRQADHDRRMQALDLFLSVYESEHGVITDEEIRAARRHAREKAIVVRGGQRLTASAKKSRRRSRRSAA
jgi:hypothetical protein